MLKRLQQIDRRIIYLVLLLALAWPIIKPIGLPFSIGAPATDAYNAVDELKSGDVAVVSFDYAPSQIAQLLPQNKAIMDHIMSKDGVKLAIIAFYAEGPMLANMIMDELAAKYGRVYGEDYVHLGYVAGVETAVSAFAKDVHKTYPTDAEGTRVTELPMMADLKSADDIDLLVGVSAGDLPVAMIRQIQGPYQTKMIVGCNAISAAINVPYYQSGQIQGYLNGLRGAAEYEALIKTPDMGTVSMDALSTGHVAIIAFILIGNLAYIMDRGQK